VNHRLSERDRKVLAKCAVAKWLTTSQLRQLYFRNITADAACKSLRRLSQAGYLVSVRENRMTEALHTIGSKAKAVLRARGLEAEASRTPPGHLEHLLGVNQVRVWLESETDRVAYFFAHWEIGKFQWVHPVIPDAIFELKCPRRCKFALEFDRATEPMNVFWRKLCLYETVLSAFPLIAVVLVTETDERLRSILRHSAARVPAVPIVGASVPGIRHAGMYSGVFWDACRPDQPARSLCDLVSNPIPRSS
jgi:hypothetical protein